MNKKIYLIMISIILLSYATNAFDNTNIDCVNNGTDISCSIDEGFGSNVWLIIVSLLIWLFSVITAVIWMPLLIIPAFISASYITYYFTQYYNSPFIGIMLLVLTVFVLVVSMRIRK